MNLFKRLKNLFFPPRHSIFDDPPYSDPKRTNAQALRELMPFVKKDMLAIASHLVIFCHPDQQDPSMLAQLAQIYLNASYAYQPNSPSFQRHDPETWNDYQTKGLALLTFHHALKKGKHNKPLENRSTAELLDTLTAPPSSPPRQSIPPAGRPEPPKDQPPKTDPARYLDPFLNHGYALYPQKPSEDHVGPAYVIIAHLLLAALEDFPNDRDIRNISARMDALPNPIAARIEALIDLLMIAADRFDRNTEDFHHRDKKFLALYLINLLGTPEALKAPATLSGFLDYLKNI